MISNTFGEHNKLVPTAATMPNPEDPVSQDDRSHISFFHNVDHLTINEGSFTLNAPNNGPSVTNYAYQQTIGINHGPIYIARDTHIAYQGEEYDFHGRINDIIPHGTGSRALRSLFSKIQQLMWLLPASYVELARYCAGRRYTPTPDLGSNVVSVVVPLFTSCLFPAMSAEVQFVVFYLLVSMVVTDLLYPLGKLNHRLEPSALVTVLDALGKYHDFPLAVCKNKATFHEEFVRRSRNQPGFFFVKSRRYEIQYNGHILHQDDCQWKAIQPWTALFVDFIIIHGEATAVKCPWCKTVTSSPHGGPDVMCTCSQCGRDFSQAEMNTLQAESGAPVVDLRIKEALLPETILRVRVKYRKYEINQSSRSSSPKGDGLKGRLRRSLSAQVLEDGESLIEQGCNSLFNSRMNTSTDHISLSSTVSSASVMIRKLSAMGKLARRNSLAGITSLFKDTEKKKDGVMGTVNSAEPQGLTPAARLARQYTLKSNAEAAAKAKEAATASGTNNVNGNSLVDLATWDRNTAASPVETSLLQRISVSTRTVIEDDMESDDERRYGHHPSPFPSFLYAGTHPHSYHWGENRELEGDEKVTTRAADKSSPFSFDDSHGGHGRPSESPAVDIRRSVKRNRKPAKGILRNAQSYDQTKYLQHDHENIISRGRSNFYISANLGLVAGMPSPDPGHIDKSSSSLNVPFGLNAMPSSSGGDLPNNSPKNQGLARTSAIFQNRTPNPSLLSSSTNSPPTLTNRFQTASMKRLTFAPNLSVYDTFPSAVYDRRSEPATWDRLTPALAQRIKEELNSYKLEEMEVHAASQIHTQFFIGGQSPFFATGW